MLPRHHNPSMQNLAQNVNAMEYERKRTGEETSPKKRMMGKIAFWTILLIVAVLFIIVFAAL